MSVTGYTKTKIDQLLSAIGATLSGKLDANDLDETTASLLANPTSQTGLSARTTSVSAVQDAIDDGVIEVGTSGDYVPTSQLVLSPTAPTSPAVGTVWINTTVV